MGCEFFEPLGIFNLEKLPFFSNLADFSLMDFMILGSFFLCCCHIFSSIVWDAQHLAAALAVARSVRAVLLVPASLAALWAAAPAPTPAAASPGAVGPVASPGALWAAASQSPGGFLQGNFFANIDMMICVGRAVCAQNCFFCYKSIRA